MDDENLGDITKEDIQMTNKYKKICSNHEEIKMKIKEKLLNTENFTSVASIGKVWGNWDQQDGLVSKRLAKQI